MGGHHLSAGNQTSTGHEASEAGWLDLHFESSRPEYEAALLDAGIRPGWSVLDAGCGSGGFLPLIARAVGPSGFIAALDLAPENIGRVEALAGTLPEPPEITTEVGSILSLPFADASFDCVWSGNVMQYLTPAEFELAVGEARRVLKPGGIFAVKDFDSTILQILPMDRALLARFMAVRLQGFRDRGVLGTDCGSTLPARLRQAGLEVVSRKGWLVERWAPAPRFTRDYVRDLLAYFASVAPGYTLPDADQAYWRELKQRPDRLLDDPDFCYREFFVMAVCRI
ncbi:methyltransferase domain-containing protein [bacterium M00.F.Ca.ET.141.01.1.1]|nr:methyltransferase domain-containing protein [bacterium M00.F.Ca.ET.141.01.1.1]